MTSPQTTSSFKQLSPTDLKVYRANARRCAADWSWDSPVMTYWDIFVIHGGEGHLQCGNWQWSLRSGSLCFLPKGRVYTGRHDPGKPLILDTLHFDIPCWDPDSIPTVAVQLEPPEATLARELSRRVRESLSMSSDLPPRWLAALLTLFDDHQCRHRRGCAFDPAIAEVCERIRNHPEQRFSVDELAECCGWSRSHFSRRFHAQVGYTVQEFQVQTRMEAAQLLLRGSDLSIGHIAEKLGFNDAAFFSKQFRNRTGLAPAAYRRSMAGQPIH